MPINSSVPTNFTFTGEYTDPTGQLYLRARYYDPSIALFTAKDPFEGVASRPMSLNGYLWVEGNPVMNTDPSGNCSEGPTCDVLWQQATAGIISTKVPIAAGCPQPPDAPCCGPDATRWIHRELDRHMSYATTIPTRIDFASIGLNFLSNMAFATAELLPMMLYGLAVDYGFVDYKTLAGESSSRFADFEYSCNPRDGSGQQQTISVCGVCQNSTDYGNFILGAVIHAAEQSWAVAFSSGALFNAVTGDWENVFGGDTQGVLAGYNYARQHSGAYNRISFCDAIRARGTGWFDGLDGNCMQSSPNLIPQLSSCTSENGGPNLDNAPASTPHYNVFVSKTLPNNIPNPQSFSTPADRLREMAGL